MPPKSNWKRLCRSPDAPEDPPRGKDKIGLRVGKEASLDGIYVVRTSVHGKALGSEDVVSAYKSVSKGECAFRSFKRVDLKVRPIYHRLASRVRAHVFLCMLAY